jgi:hypothetical protein
MAYHGADQSFTDVSDGFWGSARDFSQPPASRGRIIIVAAMYVHDLSIAANIAQLRAAEIRRQQSREKLSGVPFLFSNLPSPFAEFSQNETEVTVSADVTGVCQDFCSPQGDGPYVLKLPADFNPPDGVISGGPIGDGDCMQLPQIMLAEQGVVLGKAGFGRLKKGPAVMESANLKIGTLIASGWHPDGYYANYYPNGNHAAIFLGFVSGGFRVLEQIKGTIRARTINEVNGYYLTNPYAYNVVLIGLPIPGVPGKQKYPN